MRKHRILFLVGLTAALAAVAAGCGSRSGAEKETSQKVTESGKESETEAAETEEEKQKGMFTDLDTQDLDGNQVTTSDFSAHKLTMINTWATWCGPCADEIPELAELAKEYDKEGEISIKGLLVETDRENGTIVTGVTDKEKETALGILDASGAEYQQLLVSEGMKAYIYQIIGFPTTYFVDKDGNMVGEEIVGARSGDDWKKIIEERLAMVNE